MCTSMKNTEGLTLAQKITQLSAPSTGVILPLNPHGRKCPEEEITVCKICGSTRIHPDPTGITCGKQQCLLELGRQFEETEVINVLEKVLGMLGMKNKTSSDGTEEILNKIKGRIESMKSSLKELEKGAQTMIDDLRKELTSAAESLGLNPDTLPDIKELASLITGEVLTVKRAVENLTKIY